MTDGKADTQMSAEVEPPQRSGNRMASRTSDCLFYFRLNSFVSQTERDYAHISHKIKINHIYSRLLITIRPTQHMYIYLVINIY